jgi:hypothetical protein
VGLNVNFIALGMSEVRLLTSDLQRVMALSMYSGFALKLWTGFGKMICKDFLRRLRQDNSGFSTSINDIRNCIKDGLVTEVII